MCQAAKFGVAVYQRIACVLQVLLEKASERFPQFQEHARFLSTQEGGISRFGGLVRNFFLSSSKQNQASRKLFVNITDESELSREEFASLLKTIDLGLRGLPATAQVLSHLLHPSPSHQAVSFLLSQLLPQLI